ncbi:MAG: hypothetical protein OJF60_001135 [Burkholderiaceae bacterium]|jgi:hypothetical protein|nr:MAG: hypothetical protein OJF60_001135 [Burkholderiaceae bacterium]
MLGSGILGCTEIDAAMNQKLDQTSPAIADEWRARMDAALYQRSVPKAIEHTSHLPFIGS